MMNQIPAWGPVSEWTEANWSVDYLLKKYSSEISRVNELAREIQANLETIFSVQNDLCSETCRFCPDPCCLNATVWADLKDLLFIHLTKQKIPDTQLISKQEDHCVYHSPKGCRLPRLSRPFTCTLYLCPSQMSKFRLLDSVIKDEYDKRVTFVKQSRRKIEEMFIQITNSV